METFTIGYSNKFKRFLQSLPCPSWPTCNPTSESTEENQESSCSLPSFSICKILFTSVLFPVATVSFDMFYSDTMVGVKLVNYTVSIFNKTSNGGDISSFNSTGSETTTPGIIVVLLMIPLLAVYSLSVNGFISTPFIKYLKTSYKTNKSLLQEAVDTSTPVGKMFSLKKVIMLIISPFFQSRVSGSIYLLTSLLVRQVFKRLTSGQCTSAFNFCFMFQTWRKMTTLHLEH